MFQFAPYYWKVAYWQISFLTPNGAGCHYKLHWSFEAPDSQQITAACKSVSEMASCVSRVQGC